MISDPLIARLEAANPVPAAAPSRGLASRSRVRRPRMRLVALVAAVAIAVPAVAFAGSLGGLVGISNEGTTVAADDTGLTSFSRLNEALQQFGLSTLQLLGVRDGISFYAARNPDGHFCFAIDSGVSKGVGCSLLDNFPSPQHPLIDIFSGQAHVAGFAADGVADVALIDSSGATLATIPVTDNIYALDNPPAGSIGVEALDANGNVLYTHDFGTAP